jgi:hypothetical protein
MPKQTSTDAAPRLDAFLLHRQGALIDGAITRWRWPLPIGATTVLARTEGHRLFLAVNDGPETAFGIVPKRGTTGSSYAFLRCTCERSTPYPSTRFLYILKDRVACRLCHELDYPSRIPPWNTSRRQFHRARAQLIALELEARKGFKSVRRVP